MHITVPQLQDKLLNSRGLAASQRLQRSSHRFPFPLHADCTTEEAIRALLWGHSIPPCSGFEDARFALTESAGALTPPGHRGPALHSPLLFFGMTSSHYPSLSAQVPVSSTSLHPLTLHQRISESSLNLQTSLQGVLPAPACSGGSLRRQTDPLPLKRGPDPQGSPADLSGGPQPVRGPGM